MTTTGEPELTTDSAPAAAGGDVVYRGRHDSPSTTSTVTLEAAAGQDLGALAHVVRHSPSGFSWGYGGSGPADLARCLILDALGPERAKCPHCAGSGSVVFDAAVGAFAPTAARHETADVQGDTGVLDEGAGCSARDGAENGPEAPTTCWSCSGDGYRHVPYQDFKWDYVAGFDLEWRMTRSEILSWLASQPESLPR